MQFSPAMGMSFPTGDAFRRNSNPPNGVPFAFNAGGVHKQEPTSHHSSPYQERSPLTNQTMGYRAPGTETVDGVPAHMIHELEFNLPPPKSRGRGRGKKTGEYTPPAPPVLGKGRAATQGTLVDIQHAGREQALAEQAQKRKRFQDDELKDDSDERILEAFLNKDSSEALKKQKKRDHHACDRCYKNKTKVSARDFSLTLVSPSNRWETTG
jgi:hypothetical protein